MSASAPVRRHSSQTEWFASWFDSAHYHRLYARRDDEEAAGLVNRLIERLRPAAGAAFLDLGCGAGRHARALAAKGFCVMGLDLSAESIKRAKEHERPHLWFRRQDMRLPFGHGAFDYVLNLFTSFGYFEDPSDHVSVVHNISQALKPGGRLVLDYLNVRHADRYLKGEEAMERDGVTYHISRWTDAYHIFKRIVVDDRRTAVPLEYTERVARLTLEDFRYLFSLCDLEIQETYGDYHLAPFDVETSPRLILVAKKPAAVRPCLPAGQVLPDAADGFGSHPEV